MTNLLSFSQKLSKLIQITIKAAIVNQIMELDISHLDQNMHKSYRSQVTSMLRMKKLFSSGTFLTSNRLLLFSRQTLNKSNLSYSMHLYHFIQSIKRTYSVIIPKIKRDKHSSCMDLCGSLPLWLLNFLFLDILLR